MLCFKYSSMCMCFGALTPLFKTNLATPILVQLLHQQLEVLGTIYFVKKKEEE
jgi:hypothetical protein